MKLTILHTNDMHGRIQQLERIATLVRTIRAEVNQNGGLCLYVDAGDAEDTILLESSLTKGSAMNAMLRGAGCDYAALGNAIPARYGIQPIKDMGASFGRPLLCANLFDENGETIPGLEPFTIFEFQNQKLGIIGLTDPSESYRTFFHLKTEEAADVLPKLISDLRGRGAQTIILLSHLSSKADIELAEKVQGVDVIVGAHDHKAITPPLVVNGTIIVQAGDFGKFLGRLDLTTDSATGKVVAHEGTLLPIDESIPPDPQAQQAVANERIRIDQLMGREIGILNQAIDLADDRECSAIRSTANPAWIKLTGSQIKQFLREASKPENAARQLHGLRGRSVGMPHVAGAKIRRNGTSPEDVEIEVQGRVIKDEESFLVASTDMEFADYVGYLVIPFETVEFEVPTIMPEVMEDYIRAHTPISIPSH